MTKNKQSTSVRFQALLDRSRKSVEQGKGLSETEFWKAAKARARKRKSGK